MPELVLLRHGESEWNLTNRFSGWTDVDLTPKGIEEARTSGQLLAENGYTFDIAYTSVLKRAIRTLWTVLDEMDLMWIPVVRSWRLNERHYGALQGLDKAETAKLHGEDQVQIWRRSFDTEPPPLDPGDPRSPTLDPRYANLSPGQVPLTESLATTSDRFLPFWADSISESITRGKRVLVVAHGNSLRALVKHLDDVSESEIVDLNIPTGVPLVYDLDDNLSPRSHRYLGDEAAIAEAMKAVASQGKARGKE